MEFSIRDTLKKSWQEYKANFLLFFFLMAFNFLIQGIAPTTTRISAQLVVSLIVGLIWGYVVIVSVLNIANGAVIKPTFSYVRDSLPTFRQFFILLGIGIITGALYMIGFIVLIVPGIYLIGRLMFSTFSFIDEQKTVGESIKHSWNITRGARVWTSILVFFIVLTLSILGVILLRIGEFVTIPLALLLIAHLYRAFDARSDSPEQRPKRIVEIVE